MVCLCAYSVIFSINVPGIEDFKVIGRTEVLEEPNLEFRVHLMDLTSDDKHNMQSNPKHIPNFVVSNRLSGVFHLPIDYSIVYVSHSYICWSVNSLVGSLTSLHRLLENESLLLVIADRDKHAIYLEGLAGMGVAIQQAKAIKTLNRDKTGKTVLFAYTETKRTLVVALQRRYVPHYPCSI